LWANLVELHSATAALFPIIVRTARRATAFDRDTLSGGNLSSAQSLLAPLNWGGRTGEGKWWNGLAGKHP